MRFSPRRSFSLREIRNDAFLQGTLLELLQPREKGWGGLGSGRTARRLGHVRNCWSALRILKWDALGL